MGAVIEISFGNHADELRDCWQGLVLHRCLCVEFDLVRPKSRLGLVALSVLSHNFDEAMIPLLRAVFPSHRGVGTPFLCSAAKVAKTGHVMADIVRRNGRREKNQMLFYSLDDLQHAFRKLADSLHFYGAERRALFDAVKNWVVCDYRLDPNMDRRDPDARRLTVN